MQKQRTSPPEKKKVDEDAVEKRVEKEHPGQLGKLNDAIKAIELRMRFHEPKIGATFQGDGPKKLLWRMNRRRLEGEAIRDTILAVSSTLNPAMGGPGVYAQLPKGVNVEFPNNDKELSRGTATADDNHRRSIYLFQRRSLTFPLMDVFDGAPMNQSCAARPQTTVASQALALFNGEFTREAAGHFSKRLRREAGNDAPKQIERAFQLAFNRPPSKIEQVTPWNFFRNQPQPATRTPPPRSSISATSCSTPANSFTGTDLCIHQTELTPSRAADSSEHKFAKHGKCGMDVSELFPHIASRVDDMCFVRSLICDSNSHTPALFQMNTGTIQQGFPSLGSRLLHGPRSENPELPGFCVMVQKNALVNGGPANWGAGFLGAPYQETCLRSGTTPILHLEAPADSPPAAQHGSIELLHTLNREHLRGREDDANLSARMASYDLASRMQAHMPEAVDLSRETEETRQLYGLDDPDSEDTGRKCLLARRFVERRVRVVLVLSHTLVVGLSKFGRMPISQCGTGRDHNHGAQTICLARAGIKPGTIVGAPDPLGYRSIDSPYHMRNLHATLRRLMGLDDMRLTFYFNGRNHRLTENGGQMIHQALA